MTLLLGTNPKQITQSNPSFLVLIGSQKLPSMRAWRPCHGHQTKSQAI